MNCHFSQFLKLHLLILLYIHIMYIICISCLSGKEACSLECLQSSMHPGTGLEITDVTGFCLFGCFCFFFFGGGGWWGGKITTLKCCYECKELLPLTDKRM